MVVLTIPALEAKEGGLQIQAQVGQFRDIAALSRKEKKKKKAGKQLISALSHHHYH